jgi:capsular exopolysaccharide synthesis family protein
VSRVYDALRKLEEQGRESAQEAASAAPKTVVVPPKNADHLLCVPSLEARIRSEDRIVVYSDQKGPGAERFRLIRMALRNSQGGKAQKVLLITSPLPRDGKSTVALNLATSLAEDGKVRVLLLEADLRRPALLSHLGLERMCGLTELVEDMAEPAAAIRRIEPLGFYLLSSGRNPEHPSELLQSDRFHGLLREFKACFDWVLIDCPPAFPLADVVALRSHADGVLLVARAGSAPREAVQETAQLFKPGQVVGLILNAAEGVNTLYSKYYYRKDGPYSSARSHVNGKGERAASQELPLGRSGPAR